MREDAQRYFAGNRGSARLYAGLLLPPAAWFVHLVASYSLATLLCGGRYEWLLHVVLLTALAVVALGGLLAWRNWNDTGRGFDPDRGGVVGRSNFLAVAGLGSAAFFGLVVLLTEVPNWFLPPCLQG